MQAPAKLAVESNRTPAPELIHSVKNNESISLTKSFKLDEAGASGLIQSNSPSGEARMSRVKLSDNVGLLTTLALASEPIS